MKTLRHDPLLVRAVLADAEATSGYAAARRAGLAPKTVYRWMRARAADSAWPSDDLVEQWHHDHVVLARVRARKAAQKRDYMKRRYVAQGPMMVDPTGTVRRIRALYALGWTSPQLAVRLGVTPARVGHLASGKWRQVHRHTAARVAALYDELSMVVPRDPDVLPPRHARVHDRQRRWAAAKGWAPPLAWDDIDDPNETPTGLHTPARWSEDDVDHAVVDRVLAGQARPRRLTRAECTEIVARLVARGHTTWEIQHRWGFKPERYVRLTDREAS